MERRRAGFVRSPVTARLFSAVLTAAVCVLLSFLLLPVVAIFTRVSIATMLHELSSDVVRDALRVTVKTNLVALVLILALGTPAAYLVATRSFRGRAVVLTLIELPLVLPPAVAGIGLLAAFGRLGLLGSTLDFLGWQIGLGTQAAVVLAVAFVAGPFYVRPAVAAFEGVDPILLGAARTLGAGPARTFFRVALPLAAGGLGAGAALAFARGLGEFGATLMFAGSLQGVTQTLSLAIYQEFDVDFDSALAISGLLIVLSATLLLSVKVIAGWRSTYASLIPFARSPSTSS
jgi:molybdate transport system permease protein